MSTNIANDNLNKCRACLVENPSQLLSWTAPMETALFESITYAECFQKCTQLEAYPDDNLPKSLCFECAAQLRDAYEFIKKAIQSHQTLLMKQEPQVKLDIGKQPATFEWIAVQEKDSEEATQSHQTLLMKEEPLLKVDEGKQPASFEWIALQKKEADETTPAHKLEVISNTDGNIIDTFDPASDSISDSNPSSPQKDDHDATKTEMLTKSKNDKTKVPIKRVTKRKPSLRKLSGSSKTEKTKEQDQHSTTKSYVNCEFCNKPYPEMRIRYHIQRVHHGKKLLCHVCSHTFKDGYDLKQHLVTHNSNRQLDFTCEQCGKKFLTRTGLRNHVKTHETDWQAVYQCEQCDKQFYHKGSLKLHMVMHTDTLECKTCGKRYRRESDLKSHIRSHTGETCTPFQCRYCERAYTTVSNLKKHESEHEGFNCKCKVCGREFTSPNSYSKHKLTHMGITMKCTICEKGFNVKYRMKRHITSVHKIEIEKIEEFIQRVK